jgi:serine/threonine-protein kinase
MAPEQLRNFRDVKPQSDIYGLGMTAYSLLTGEMALDLAGKSSVAETVKAIFEQPIIPLASRAPHFPPALCEVIDRALAKDQTQRWQTAGAMRTAMLHAVQ